MSDCSNLIIDRGCIKINLTLMVVVVDKKKLEKSQS